MPVDDAFHKRERFLEEEYFHKREQELIAEMRRRAAASESVKELSERLGLTVPAPDLIEAILDLGFSGQLSPMLFLTQIVRVAWADGSVSPPERKMIIEMARKDGIPERGVADMVLTQWLENKPSEEFFSNTLLAIRGVMMAIPRDLADARRNEIISRARAVAVAPEGVLHLRGALLETEQRVLDSIEAELLRDLQT